ncbi:alpha/beta fold hydrolase [Paracoccus alkanivorans]|uniref:Alpha/beta fold hydrolase n=1 Tax=Paracoccus alkanivorans TaxID=2116655 RepID=A0A3M0MKK1_9RHOB|nr:alpha/beta fold hydrolase [Paracoccus alkanivorans]RMC37965.1 alpha/beta fold hydrolase [Paracoccus alkanivorans]
MTVTLTMPRLGETMEEGTVASWLIEPGQRFKRGDALVEFETDKTAVEYPALGPGLLVEVLAQPGDVVQLGAPIARIDLEGADDWVTETVPEEGVADGETPVADAENDLAVSVGNSDVVAKEAEGGPVRATPLARRAARRAGLDITRLRGTGRRGRIELSDIQAAEGRTSGGLASSYWGPEGGTPVLLVHGFAGDRITFEQLGKGLGRAGLRARAVDLPGHGETVDEAAGFDDLVAALLAELTPARPVHLIGHSLGAAVAVRAARQGGAASLTLIAPAGLGLGIDHEFITGMAEAASPGTVSHLLRRLSNRAAGFSEDMISRIHVDLSRGRLRELAANIAPEGRQGVDVVPDLAALAAELPVRIIIGHRDAILDWRDAVQVSPRIAVHHLPAAGHMPHWDSPAEVLDIIVKGVRDG